MKNHQKEKPTFNQLATKYMEEHVNVNRKTENHQETQKLLEIIFEYFDSKKLEEITSHDIQGLLHDLCDTPFVADRVRALLNKMFSLAIQWRWASANPVNDVDRYIEDKQNSRFNDEALQQLFSVLDTYPDQKKANAIRFLLLMGARKEEVLKATWDQFDLEKGTWTKPAAMTKHNKVGYSLLSPQAIEMLKNMQGKSNSLYLFPDESIEKPLQNIKEAWYAMRSKANLPDVRLSDLRYVYAYLSVPIAT